MRELYRKGDARPQEVASRIVSALDPTTRAEMAGRGPACCLSALLRASKVVASQGLPAIWQAHPESRGPDLLRLAQAVRGEAEEAIAGRGLASRFSDIALNAVATAVMDAGAGGGAEVFNVPAEAVAANFGGPAEQGHLADLSVCFLAHDLDHIFRYFVTRDLSDFVGTEALPTVAHGSQLRDAVTSYCRAAARRVEAAALEETLRLAVQQDFDEGLDDVQATLGELTERGLKLAAAGGGS